MMDSDLGFTFFQRKDGSVAVLHDGRPAATLRGRQAEAFLVAVDAADAAAAQQLMARVTGNYKRGNERSAKRHPRNRA